MGFIMMETRSVLPVDRVLHSILQKPLLLVPTVIVPVPPGGSERFGSCYLGRVCSWQPTEPVGAGTTPVHRHRCWWS